QDLHPALAAARREIFSHLPIHRRLQGVLDAERAAVDEEITVERRKTRDAAERAHEIPEVDRVNVRVRRLRPRGFGQIALHARLVEVRMIEPERHRAVKTVEVEQLAAAHGVDEIWPAAFAQVDDDAEAVDENMLLQFPDDVLRDDLSPRVHPRIIWHQ